VQIQNSDIYLHHAISPKPEKEQQQQLQNYKITKAVPTAGKGLYCMIK
jgi:hypothetical protein